MIFPAAVSEARDRGPEITLSNPSHGYTQRPALNSLLLTSTAKASLVWRSYPSKRNASRGDTANKGAFSSLVVPSTAKLESIKMAGIIGSDYQEKNWLAAA